jgi:hypothetical protein
LASRRRNPNDEQIIDTTLRAATLLILVLILFAGLRPVQYVYSIEPLQPGYFSYPGLDIVAITDTTMVVRRTQSEYAKLKGNPNDERNHESRNQGRD